MQPFLQFHDLGRGPERRRQAAERLQDDPLRRGRIWCSRVGEPVGIGFELPHQLIDSIALEGLHATFAQGNAAELSEVTSTL